MPSNANVFVHYGPYETCANVEHQKHRLEGLLSVLGSAGHTVKLVEISYWNTVNIVVNGENVFSCDLTNLDFGGDGQLDPLCRDALQKVNEAF